MLQYPLVWRIPWATFSALDIFQKNQTYLYIDTNKKFKVLYFFLASSFTAQFVVHFCGKSSAKNKKCKNIDLYSFIYQIRQTEQQKCIKFNVIIRDMSSKNF
jgi:hypothetical protein